MGVIDYENVPKLDADILPDKLTGEVSPDKLTDPNVTALQVGLKVNAVIDALDVIGTRVNELIDALATVGATSNILVNHINWLGNVFKDIELIGDRRYLAYQPGEDVPELEEQP